MPRPYTQHSAATVAYLRREYGRQTMPQIAAELGIAPRKLYALAARQGLTKNWVKS